VVIDLTQSPEADLDREIERLIGDMVRGNLTASDRVRLGELQSRRSKLLRPPSPAPSLRPIRLHSRRFA
jgi:hypothetical protein